MKIGAIYAYAEPDTKRWVYVGSVQDEHKVGRRHRAHLKEKRGLLAPWLAKVGDSLPTLMERVEYENVDQLYARENHWIDKLNTLAKQGGLNQVHAGGPDLAEIGRISSDAAHQADPSYREKKSKAGKIGAAKYVAMLAADPVLLEKCRERGRINGALQPREAKVLGGIIGGRRSIEMHGSPQTYEGSSRGGKVTGRINILKTSRETRDRLGKNVGSKYGHIGGLRSRHNFWHVRRGIPNPNCELCKAEATLGPS